MALTSNLTKAPPIQIIQPPAHQETCFFQAGLLPLSPCALYNGSHIFCTWNVAHPFPSTLKKNSKGEGLRDLYRFSEMK